MEPKNKTEVPDHSPHKLRSRHQRPTSKQESEVVRKRGYYVVLPTDEGPQEEVDWDDWPALIL